MSTWTIKFYPYNILEFGTVTVTGDPDTGYIEARLYDRVISTFWKDTVTEAKTFHVDQGASGNLAVDFLAIEKHNFSGEDMQWQYSIDDFSADINDAVTDWTQDDNNQIIKTISEEQTKRYWRVTLSSMTDPQCSEIFMSKGYSFNCLRNQRPSGRDVSNVQWNRTVGGEPRSTKFGPKKQYRTYSMWLSASEYSNFKTVISYLNEYEYPFYFRDHEENYYMAKFDGEPDINFNHDTHTLVTFSIIEI